MSISAKDSIIKAAKLLFGEKGFEGASVRDISKRAKVNIAMIHYYFGCKENLYRSVLGEFAQEMILRHTAILSEPKDEADFRQKLTALIETIGEPFEQNAPLLRILIREIKSDKKQMTKEMMNLTTPFFFSIRDFFQMAIDKQIIKGTIAAENIALIFLGALSHPIEAEIPLKKTLGKNMNDEDFRDKYCKNLVSVLLDGVVK